jgi:hypothetical protein
MNTKEKRKRKIERAVHLGTRMKVCRWVEKLQLSFLLKVVACSNGPGSGVVERWRQAILGKGR